MGMSSDEEKKQWQERNTFYCRRLRAWLSPEACAANRKKPVLRYGGMPDRYRPTACADCTDWRALCRQVELRRAGGEEEDVMAKARKVCTCPECGERKKIIGRGLCGACWMRLKKSGRLDEKYPLPAAAGAAKDKGDASGPATPLPPDAMGGEEVASSAGDGPWAEAAGAAGGGAIRIDLSRVAGLESYLGQRAEDNLRTLESEILVILRWAMQASKESAKGAAAPWDRIGLTSGAELHSDHPVCPGDPVFSHSGFAAAPLHTR